MFKHDFGEKKKKPQMPVASHSVEFLATIEGQRALRDGGLSITLGLAEREFVVIAQLLAMRNMVLRVMITPEPEQ